MRPLPRLLAIADDAVCQADDFPIKAAAILSVGPSVAIVIRSMAPEALGYLLRVRSLARPSEGGVFGYASESIAREAGAQGLIVPEDPVNPAGFWIRPRRAVSPNEPGPGQAQVSAGFSGAIGADVPSIAAARIAAEAGADFLVVGWAGSVDSVGSAGSIGRAGSAGVAVSVGRAGSAGVAGWWIDALALGIPVFLPGDGTVVHRAPHRAAGAYGIAVGPTLWRSRDPAEATAAVVGAWTPE